MIIPSGRFIVNTRALAWSHYRPIFGLAWTRLPEYSREAVEAEIKTLCLPFGMMHTLAFTLSPESVVHVHDAVVCLSKFSESVSIEARHDKVTHHSSP